MPVQINEVLVKAVVADENCVKEDACKKSSLKLGTNDASSAQEILEIIEEVLRQNKER